MKKEEIFAEMMESIYSFSKLSNRYQNISRKYGSDIELYMAEAHMIQIIGYNEGITVTELSKIKNISKSAVSQIIKKLSSKNLIIKEINATDKKTYVISLSDEGKQIFAFHNKLDENNYKKYMNQLGNINEDDMIKTKKLMDILIKEFNEELNKEND